MGRAHEQLALFFAQPTQTDSHILEGESVRSKALTLHIQRKKMKTRLGNTTLRLSLATRASSHNLVSSFIAKYLLSYKVDSTGCLNLLPWPEGARTQQPQPR